MLNVKIKREKISKFYFGPSKDKVALLVLSMSKNNMFFTLTDLNGLVIGTASSGLFKLKKDYRVSPQTAELLLKRLISYARFCGIQSINLILKLTSIFIINSTIRLLMFYGFKVNNIIDSILIPHNGCRKKKLRRI